MFRYRDHRDTKLDIELRMSSNEKEEEGKKKLAHDYINAYASHRIKKTRA